MPLSRALKEQTTCKTHTKSSGKKESAKVSNSKQYNQSGPKYTGQNMPQWHLGGKDTIKAI